MMNDTPERYGRVSRLFHWAVAALILWQLGGMVLKTILGRTPLMAFWVGSHQSVGVLVFVLILLRAGWALRQRRRRPAHGGGWIGRAATAGHGALYLLMLVVPTLAVLRMIGSGRPVVLWGVTLSEGGGAPVAWMTAPANLLHGTLAWLLLVLIVGHVAMVAVHRLLWKDDVLGRMAGRPQRTGAVRRAA